MPATIEDVLGRIEDKKRDYQSYDFTRAENDAFKTFFDLAQEFEDTRDFYNLCVAVPKAFFGLDARLYLIDPGENRFLLATATEEAEHPPATPVEPDRAFYYTGNNGLALNIRGKKQLIDQLPFSTINDVLGILEVYPARDLGPHRELFFEKYANRIGYNLHNRFLAEKNVEHLRFIRTLVADIEHNIIAPNIVYKLYLKNLEGAASRNAAVEKYAAERSSGGGLDRNALDNVLSELAEVNRSLRHELDDIAGHHRNMSLFLETLLRRSHFERGRLILRTKKCNIKKEVLEPQLGRFLDRFRSMGISVDEGASAVPEDEVSVVDVGLMAQVYANLFSNALKYAGEITTDSGQRRKYASYGYEVVPGCFGEGKDGMKYNVFSTGPHIREEERERIFEDRYRGSNIGDSPGTGHGLSFIKNVVELHGGVVGYEPTRYGNNFYFTLPK